jgi:hypothetical protein
VPPWHVAGQLLVCSGHSCGRDEAGWGEGPVICFCKGGVITSGSMKAGNFFVGSQTTLPSSLFNKKSDVSSLSHVRTYSLLSVQNLTFGPCPFVCKTSFPPKYCLKAFCEI